MGRAFVKLERGSNLGQAQGGVTFTKKVQNREGSIEGLDFICTLWS